MNFLSPYMTIIKGVAALALVLAILGFGWHLAANHYKPQIAALTSQVGSLQVANKEFNIASAQQSKSIEDYKLRLTEAQAAGDAALKVAKAAQEKSRSKIIVYQKEIATPNTSKKTCVNAISEIRKDMSSE